MSVNFPSYPAPRIPIGYDPNKAYVFGGANVDQGVNLSIAGNRTAPTGQLQLGGMTSETTLAPATSLPVGQSSEANGTTPPAANFGAWLPLAIVVLIVFLYFRKGGI